MIERAVTMLNGNCGILCIEHQSAAAFALAIRSEKRLLDSGGCLVFRDLVFILRLSVSQTEQPV